MVVQLGTKVEKQNSWISFLKTTLILHWALDLSGSPLTHLQALAPELSGEKPAASDFNHWNLVPAFSGLNPVGRFPQHDLQAEVASSCVSLPLEFPGNHLVKAFKELQAYKPSYNSVNWSLGHIFILPDNYLIVELLLIVLWLCNCV